MLTETLSGKCPCCNYDKLFQRYGSIGYRQLDGCANCGFGYSTNHHDDDDFGTGAWLPYAKMVFSSQFVNQETNEFFEKILRQLNKMPNERARRIVFEWCEKKERSDDVDTTVFKYSDEDIEKHKSFCLPVFKTVKTIV